jgi:hypothetical protein
VFFVAVPVRRSACRRHRRAGLAGFDVNAQRSGGNEIWLTVDESVTAFLRRSVDSGAV